MCFFFELGVPATAMILRNIAAGDCGKERSLFQEAKEAQDLGAAAKLSIVSRIILHRSHCGVRAILHVYLKYFGRYNC